MKKYIIIFLLLAVGAIGVYLVRPLFVDDIVDEALPNELSLSDFDNAMEFPSEEEFASMSEKEQEEKREELFNKAQTMEVSVNDRMKEQPTNFPKILSQGSFQDADDFHKGSGQAKVLQLSEEQLLIRLEDFSVTNGPDLFVYLTKHPNPASSSDVQEGFVNIGRLKGNKGNQNYELPKDLDLNEFQSVVIYCKAFSTLFSSAPLS